MVDNEENEPSKEPEEEYEDSSGFDEMLYSLAEALRAKRSKEAIAALIEHYAAEIPVVARRRYRAMLWSYGFTLLVLISVGVLGWMKVINGETAGTLLGAVVGSIFYRNNSR
jgi:hypothetical protein